MKILLIAALWASSCQTGTGPYSPPPSDPVPFPPEPYDAAPPPLPVPVPGDDCGQAEVKAQELGCPLAATRNGIPWATVCRVNAANGNDMRPRCVAGAADCSAVTACLNR